MKKHGRLAMLVLLDFLFIVVALIGACLLSEDGISLFSAKWYVVAIIAIMANIIVFLRTGLYRAVLKYASVDFLLAVLKATTLSSIGILLLLRLAEIHLSPRVLIINWILTIFCVGGSRFVVRYFQEYISPLRNGKHVLIYGAGDLGVMALRWLKQEKAPIYIPIGFIDDDKRKKKGIIQNLRILGSWNQLDQILSKTMAKGIIIARSNISGEELRKIVKDCRQRKISCKIVPTFSNMVKMEPAVRDIEIADLLRRSPRDLDNRVVDSFIKNKKVLITGAAGSIGSELVRQCLKHEPLEVIALDQSENGLYNIKEELGEKANYVLGNVTSELSINMAFEEYQPDIVFHAAAYKHVPMLQSNIKQAVINNIEGTKIVAEAANRHNVKKFVLISTDKAVKPSSIMGSTKRVCELFIQNFNSKSKTEFVAVRFGNVLGSSGSVIPKFIDQIRSNCPITITHPEATRYFMLTSEAVSLVLQAASIGNGGSIFILDMGNPVKIVEMAEDLIYLMGREPYSDIEIKFTGLRPGEKIYEELIGEEIDDRTIYENITIAKATILPWEWFSDTLEKTIEQAKKRNNEDTLILLNTLVNNANLTNLGNCGFEKIRATPNSVKSDLRNQQINSTQIS